NASAITGSDLVTELDTDYDMTMSINCEFEDWYMGTDANPPAGTFDFVTVFLHEIGHGIGFTGSMTGNATSQIADWGYGQSDFYMVYDMFALDEDFRRLVNTDVYPRRSELLYNALTGQFGGVYFSGPQAQFAYDNARVQLHSPDPFVQGQSYAHLNQQLYGNTENALMRPFLDAEFAVHSPGPIFCGLLNDFNWPLGQACLDLLPDEGFLNRPFLVFPENGSFETTLDPTLMWQAVAGAAEYRIQLATDFSFNEVIIDQVVNGTSFDIQQPLEYSTLYFWRVQAIGTGGNSKFSTKYRFTTSNRPPDTIVLLQPDDNSVNLRPGFSFVWQEASRADEYQLQVAENASFTDPVIDATISVPRYLNTGVLDFSTTYYWRVRGLNSAGEGDWSEVRTLTTIIEKPDPVSLSFPGENENQVPVLATLNWEESERASEYIIQISRNEMFTSDGLIKLTSSEPMITLNTALEFATIYYWRVKATNIGGESDWSKANRFTTVVRETAIAHNYPNPFNSSTTIRFQLSQNSDVTLDLFDSVGRRVFVLIDEERPPGVYFEQLQAAGFASGTYFLRIVAGDFMEVQKLAIIK
ncbi:MAG: T9SS type A sorting domain-containing protein, partial [Balneolaceae bacterium]|nr:T9SS type A sorting domain-containing protein [Balneolaceae bacterium]